MNQKNTRISIEDISNSKSFLIKNFKQPWPFNYNFAGELYAQGEYTSSVKQLLMKIDDKIPDKKNPDIIHFVYNEEFFFFKGKVYFKYKNYIWNLDSIPYNTLVTYGIKQYIIQGNGNISSTWQNIFFYLINPRFSSDVQSILKQLKQENYFQKHKNEIFKGFRFGFQTLRVHFGLSTLTKLSAEQKQNLIFSLLYLGIPQSEAEKLIFHFTTKNDVSEILEYLEKIRLSFTN